jgi:F-box protein 9
LAASGCPTYRQLFLLRPRIRTDGIYISKITYFRPGFSASSMINPVHLVTYFRYLRFFGAAEKYTVWWLTSTITPARVLSVLRNPPRSTPVDMVATGETANVFHGHWRRSPEVDNVLELSLSDPKGSKGRSMQWRMQVELPPSKPSGSVKHNVMRCLLYEAVSESEPPLVIDIGNWNTFFFSKVRSYLT